MGHQHRDERESHRRQRGDLEGGPHGQRQHRGDRGARKRGGADDQGRRSRCGAPVQHLLRGVARFPVQRRARSCCIHDEATSDDTGTVVMFRRSDVIAAGDLFRTEGYPVIDLANGGSIDGTIAGLNRILDLTVPSKMLEEGGTYVIPGHGRISDEHDVAMYRDMLVIIRDRIRSMVEKKMTLEQVKAARPTLDYDGRYGTDTGPWTTAMFIEAIYRELSGVGGLRRAEERAMTMRARCPRGILALPRDRSRNASTPPVRGVDAVRRPRSAADRASGCADSISPAPGYLSSPRIGAGGWSHRRKAMWRAFPSVRKGARPHRAGISRPTTPAATSARRSASAGSCASRPAPHLVAGRPDAEARVRRRHADAAAEFRSRGQRLPRRAGRDSRSRSGRAPAWGAVRLPRIRVPPVAASCRAVSRAAAARVFAAVRRHAQQAEINSGGNLKVVTTNFREGYLRKNGVPYSEQASITEYIHRLPDASQRRFLAPRADDDRGSEVPERRVLHEHELPAGAGWIEVQPVGVQD